MKLLSPETIRRCLVADPGYSMLSSDFDQIELRIIAALAGEPVLIDAAKRGESLHEATAKKLFGEHYTPDEYKRTKNINFTWAFGGGASTMTRRYGIPIEESTALIRNYESQFTKLKAFKKRQQDKILRSCFTEVEYKQYKTLLSRMFDIRDDTRAGKQARAAIKLQMDRMTYRRTGFITTHFGRKILVDAHKPYTGINYEVQGTAADILKFALLDVMDDSELEPTVLLPIHDEILGQAPKRKAEYIAQRYGEVMSREFLGVPLTATGKVYGPSWGHGYRKQD